MGTREWGSVRYKNSLVYPYLDLQAKKRYIGNINGRAFLDRLDTLNDLIRQLIESMPKPANRFTSVLETAALIAGVFSIITIADVMMKWITGE